MVPSGVLILENETQAVKFANDDLYQMLNN